MTDSNLITGGCHCGAVSYRLHWPASPIPVRRCTCDYCTAFNGRWTSHPDARLDIEYRTEPARYRFATRTADFLFCSCCGVHIAALSVIGDRLQAVINVNTFQPDHGLEMQESDSCFDREAVDQRLDRRQQRWIGSVSLSQIEE